MARSSRGRRAVVATAALAAATITCSAGHLLGMVTGPAAPTVTAVGAADGTAPAAGSSRAARSPAGTGSIPAPAGAGGDRSSALAVPVDVPAAVPPVTGPGRPPLPMTGSGPHGTLRTTGDAYVALTFDDGPDPRWTPAVLELLRAHQVKATFCVVGRLAEEFPGLVRAIAGDGHTLCNHSWSHDVGLGRRSRAAIRADLERTTEAVRAAVPGARVSYYRQPGGAWTQRVVEVAEELGMSSLHWAVDPRDWARPGAGAIAEVVTAGTGKGEIVLLHDGGGERRGTVRALRRILAQLGDRLQLDALPPGVDPPRRHGREFPVKPGQR